MASSLQRMLGRLRTGYFLAALVATAVAAGCSGSEDASTATTTSEPAPVDEPVSSQREPGVEPAMASVDDFVRSWADVVAEFPALSDLAPTISSADVEADPTIGVDVFVEQVTARTVIGGIVDPESGTVTGLMGLTEPDSDESVAMIRIIWVGAFGEADAEVLQELFPLEEISALEIGEQMTRIHRNRSIVMNHADGADPESGLHVFTVGDDSLVEDDPSHDSITNVVLGLLVRTS